MSAYYNENDPKAAAWLRELIKAGLIAEGDVDERSITDVRGTDLAGYCQCHFFAGIGGWSYALRLAGIPDSEPWWTGSCPCQPFSQAGQGKGEQDSRHLWPYLRRLIEECAPATVLGEQVASKAGRRWLDGVRTDLEAMAYEVGASDLCSAGVGAPHIRQRLYWVAQSNSERLCEQGTAARSDHDRQTAKRGEGKRAAERVHEVGARGVGNTHGSGRQTQRHVSIRTIARPEESAHPSPYGGVADADGGHGGDRRIQRSGEQRLQPQNGGIDFWNLFDIVHCTDDKARRIEPGTFPLAHGIPARMGRLRGYGNAITPEVAAEFIGAFMEAAA